MYKYLLATDGSESSIHAAEYVKKVAGEHRGAEVHIVSVKELAAWFTINLEEVIEKTVNVFKGSKVQIYTIIKEGDPSQTIVETAEGLGVDHIVMGARGLGRVKGMLLGSVSQKVINMSKIPITIIK